MYSMYTFSEFLSFHYHTPSHSQLCLVFPYLKTPSGGAPGWLSPLSVQLLVSAQVMISRFQEFEPHIRLYADSVEPAWDSFSLPLSLHLLCSHCLCLSQR